MNKDEALKQALEALENHCGNYKLDDAGCERWNKAVAAIKEALVQPQERPWVGLTETQIARCWNMTPLDTPNNRFCFYRAINARLKDLNT